MKKLMKAIAFATVMCMLLSTAAFAAIADPEVTYDATKTLNISITENGNNEQVSLLILKTSASLASIGEGDILYIDQAAANASGTATFTAALDTEETTVAIYSGNATYAASGAETAYQCLGEVSLVAPITEVAIMKTESGAILGSDGNLALYADVAFTAIPEGYTLDKMVWAIKLADGTYKYTQPITNLGEKGYDVLSGSTKFSAIMVTPDGEFSDSADAIFLFVKDGAENKEAYSDNREIHEGKKN